jgi:hypothetical protein
MKVLDRSRLLVTATALVVGGCATEPPPPPGAFQASVYQEGVPGGLAIDVATTSAIVTDIDQAKRELTLLQSDGSKVSFVAGPEVKNFDQIKVGDHVKAEVSNQLDLSLQRGASARPDGTSSGAAVAARGDKPGIVTTTTTQLSGKIVNMDKTARTVTLEFADGKMARFPVRSDVDMSKAKFGDHVVMRNTTIHSIVVETPQ